MHLPFSNPAMGVSLRYWNEGASMPLTIPVQMVCNTSDEQLARNVYANSRLDRRWQKAIPAHDGVAIMCGSGPSLGESLDEIRTLYAEGLLRIFAMNGAARFLNDHLLFPDYQIIVDPRPETAQLIGPACNHLLASQCDPSLFAALPDAILWHQEIGGIDDHLPDTDRGYTLIGGAGSVGNSALCLAYAMGFREAHLFGYDSCHRGEEGHAFAQPMNAGDPLTYVRFRGKDYLTSLTMKLQAERFIGTTAPALRDAGMRITVHGDGLLPDMYNATPAGLSEVEKYREMWSLPGYREFSPGEVAAKEFVKQVEWDDESLVVIDFGCGTGRGGMAIEKTTDAYVVFVDFVNALDDNAFEDELYQADLVTDKLPVGDYGFCCDVLEHLPPEHLAPAIRNMMGSVPIGYFQISTVSDKCGAFIGETLHLSVHPAAWWLSYFEGLGFVVTWSRTSDDSVALMVKHGDAR